MKIDIGCGNNKREGYVGVDKNPQSAADVICDVDKDGLPFRDCSIEAVHSCFFLEHILNIEFVLREINRVCQPGAIIELTVPDPAHEWTHVPGHVTPWGRYWFLNHLKLWELEKLEDYYDIDAYEELRQYFPDIPIEVAAKFFWNIRKSIHVVCRKRP